MAKSQRDPQPPHNEPRRDRVAVGLLITIVLLLGLAVIMLLLSVP